MNPLYKLGAAAVVLLLFCLACVGAYHHIDKGGYDRAVAERAARDAVAVFAATKDNAVIGIKQDGFNTTITKAKDETLQPVIQRIYVDRVRVGPGICPAAAPAKTEDATSSNAGNPPGRLVSPEAESRIRDLDVEVEKHLATGRACQEFGRLNGFYP